MKKTVMVLWLCAAGLSPSGMAAQEARSISIGVAGGAPLLNPLEVRFSESGVPESFSRYEVDDSCCIVGVTGRFDFSRRFGIQADALRRTGGYYFRDSFSESLTGQAYERWVDSTFWDFPILGVYRPRMEGAVRPAIVFGGMIRRASARTTRVQGGIGLESPEPYELTRPTTLGWVAGGGLEYTRGYIRVSPQLRYAMVRENFSMLRLASERHQLDLVIGISFHRSID